LGAKIYLATVALLTASGLAGVRAGDGEAGQLTGRWELVSEVIDGEMTECTAHTAEWVFRGERLTDLIDGKELFRTRYRLLPHSDPKGFDLMEKDGRRVANRAIYTVDGDTFTIAFYREVRKARPADFKSKLADDKVVRVYRREKS
jgi:uncharacterized protein (TIGR03067 family)